MKKIFFLIINYFPKISGCTTLLIINSFDGAAQLKWTNVDSLYQPLPKSVHVYFTNEPIDTAPFRAFYLVADLKDKKLDFTADTTLNRRITPNQFYHKCEEKFVRDDCRYPLVVVNCTFFSFETNKSLNVVIRDGKLLSQNWKRTRGRGADSIHYYYPNTAAIGITKKREADVAWIKSDSLRNYAMAREENPLDKMVSKIPRGTQVYDANHLIKWKMKTAVGGGPALLHNGDIRITNNEEMMFAGMAINDKHPRTAMGYTKDGKLIILMIEGRNKNAGGATLTQEAQIFKDLGCWEALNLDGGGSSCMLVNGKQTIKPSDITGQRPVPAVFEIFVK